MEFIENKEENGIKYEFNLIKKEYLKLNIPREYDFLQNIPIETLHWFIINSPRSVGKTTNFLLYGMCMHKLYGTIIQYVRLREEEVKANKVSELFNTILSYKNGYYIKKMTNNRYNSVCYHWKKYYYCNVDEKNRIIEKAETPFLQFLSIDRNNDYKSSYNAPNGDFIILDEFIRNSYTRQDDFINFCDLLKTIIRDRMSAKIFLLANTIDVNSNWFRELTIDREIKKMRIGESRICYTSKDMPLFVSLLAVKNKQKREKHSNMFFGFENPKLASITGADTWSFKNAPHIFKDVNKKVIFNRIFLKYYVELFKIDIVKNDNIGIFLEIHPATYIYEDSIIYTNLIPEQKNEIYMLGKGNKLEKFMYSCFKNAKVFYSDNATADSINKFLTECENKKRV